MSETPANRVSDFIIPKFHPVLGDVLAHGHTHYWLHGGRESTKSSFISVCLVLLIISFPKANAVVVRRFSNTLRDSVYQQVLWAIEADDCGIRDRGREHRDDGHRRLGRARGGGVLASADL